MVLKKDQFDVKAKLGEKVDYAIVHSELDNLRQFTWNWLTNALKERNIL